MFKKLKGLLNKKLKFKFVIGFIVEIESTKPQFHTYIAVFYFPQISICLIGKTVDNQARNKFQCDREFSTSDCMSPQQICE